MPNYNPVVSLLCCFLIITYFLEFSSLGCSRLTGLPARLNALTVRPQLAIRYNIFFMVFKSWLLVLSVFCWAESLLFPKPGIPHAGSISISPTLALPHRGGNNISMRSTVKNLFTHKPLHSSLITLHLFSHSTYQLTHLLNITICKQKPNL